MNGEAPADTAADLERLKDVGRRLMALGIEGSSRIEEAVAASLQAPNDEGARAAAYAQAWRTTAQMSAQLLEGELDKMRRVLEATDQGDVSLPDLVLLREAFTNQRRGLLDLVRYIDTGDESTLARAEQAIVGAARQVAHLRRP